MECCFLKAPRCVKLFAKLATYSTSFTWIEKAFVSRHIIEKKGAERQRADAKARQKRLRAASLALSLSFARGKDNWEIQINFKLSQRVYFGLNESKIVIKRAGMSRAHGARRNSIARQGQSLMLRRRSFWSPSVFHQYTLMWIRTTQLRTWSKF